MEELGGCRESQRVLFVSIYAVCMLSTPPMHLPCQAQAPKENHQLQCQVGHKEGVVAFTHAVLHPGTVVVIAANTTAAVPTVAGSQGLLWAQKGVQAQCRLPQWVERAEGHSPVLNLGDLPGGEARSLNLVPIRGCMYHLPALGSICTAGVG